MPIPSDYPSLNVSKCFAPSTLYSDFALSPTHEIDADWQEKWIACLISRTAPDRFTRDILHNHLERHFGSDSTYSQKELLASNCKKLYLCLVDGIDNLRLTEHQKQTLVSELIEDIEFCTPGFHNRTQSTLNFIVVPKTTTELLAVARQTAIDNIARYHTAEVHTHNRFFLVANAHGFNIHPPNPYDPYPGEISDAIIIKKINDAFLPFYDGLYLICHLYYVIQSELRLRFEYTGVLEEGYKARQYDRWIDYFSVVFKKPFATAELLVIDDDFRIKDVLWDKIYCWLINLYLTEDYFTFPEPVKLALTVFADPDASLTETDAQTLATIIGDPLSYHFFWARIQHLPEATQKALIIKTFSNATRPSALYDTVLYAYTHEVTPSAVKAIIYQHFSSHWFCVFATTDTFNHENTLVRALKQLSFNAAAFILSEFPKLPARQRNALFNYIIPAPEDHLLHLLAKYQPSLLVGFLSHIESFKDIYLEGIELQQHFVLDLLQNAPAQGQALFKLFVEKGTDMVELLNAEYPHSLKNVLQHLVTKKYELTQWILERWLHTDHSPASAVQNMLCHLDRDDHHLLDYLLIHIESDKTVEKVSLSLYKLALAVYVKYLPSDLLSQLILAHHERTPYGLLKAVFNKNNLSAFQALFWLVTETATLHPLLQLTPDNRHGSSVLFDLLLNHGSVLIDLLNTLQASHYCEDLLKQFYLHPMQPLIRAIMHKRDTIALALLNQPGTAKFLKTIFLSARTPAADENLLILTAKNHPLFIQPLINRLTSLYAPDEGSSSAFPEETLAQVLTHTDRNGKNILHVLAQVREPLRTGENELPYKRLLETVLTLIRTLPVKHQCTLLDSKSLHTALTPMMCTILEDNLPLFIALKDHADAIGADWLSFARPEDREALASDDRYILSRSDWDPLTRIVTMAPQITDHLLTKARSGEIHLNLLQYDNTCISLSTEFVQLLWLNKASTACKIIEMAPYLNQADELFIEMGRNFYKPLIANLMEHHPTLTAPFIDSILAVMQSVRHDDALCNLFIGFTAPQQTTCKEWLMNPLHDAAVSHFLKACLHLLQRHARPLSLLEKFSQHDIQLGLLILESHTSLAPLYLEKLISQDKPEHHALLHAHLCQTTKEGKNILHLLARHHTKRENDSLIISELQLKNVLQLIKNLPQAAQFSLVRQLEQYGYNPLMYALRYQCTIIVDFILDLEMAHDAKCEILTQTSLSGRCTPLSIASHFMASHHEKIYSIINADPEAAHHDKKGLIAQPTTSRFFSEDGRVGQKRGRVLRASPESPDDAPSQALMPRR